MASLRFGEADTFNSVEIIPFANSFYHFLCFSPDGQKIYFTIRDDAHRQVTMMRVSILGGQVQELVTDINSFFTFSPDGRTIAFMRRDEEEGTVSVVVADAESGKNERVLLTRERPENISGSGLSWSPDGKLIAFAEAEDGKGFHLAAVNVENGAVQRISEPAEGRIVNLAWLRDGSGLIVNRNDAFYPNDGTIWHVPYPSALEKPLTDESLSYSFRSLSTSSNGRIAVVLTRADPQIRIAADSDLKKSELVLGGSRMRQEGMHGLAWAPDGKIVFAAIANGSRTIWEMAADGTSQKQLTPFYKDSSDAQVSVTADNRYIVFDSNRSGTSEIWRANRDGSDLKPLTSGGGNMQPTLSPDGRWVIYVSLRKGKYGLRRISIDGSEPIELTAEKSYWPAVSPDGRFIAFVYGGSGGDSTRDISIIPSSGGEALKSFQATSGAVLYNRLNWADDSKAVVYKNEYQGLWRHDVSTNTAEDLPSPDDFRVIHFAFSRDGKLVVSGGLQMREIVILEKTN